MQQAEQAVNESTVSQTTTRNDATDNSVFYETNEASQVGVEASAGSPQTIQISVEEYENYVRGIKEVQIAKKIKAMGSEFTTRRNTLIVRKALSSDKNFIRDEEVVAYYDLYKMREAVQSVGKKVNISDAEIVAYLKLWTGSTSPSLEAVENHIAKQSI